MTILTNIERFPADWTAYDGTHGDCIVAKTFLEFVRHLRRSDVVLINSDPRLLLLISLLFTLIPFLRRPLLGADIVLRVPEQAWQQLTLRLKRVLLARVDHFIHLFRDLSGYQRYFGIGPDRSSFVPFKPNLRYHCDIAPNPDGEYVLCFGQSMRDFDTFFDAVEKLPYPAAIARPDFERLRRHGSRFSRKLSNLPKNVRIIEHDPSSYDSQVDVLMAAKIVVVPLLKSCLVMAGTPLNAMLLGKCVIVTDGPAINGLFTNEVLPVPPEDPDALARIIDQAWNDPKLREETAAAGYRHATALGGEPELAQRLVDKTVEWWNHHANGTRPALQANGLIPPR